MLREEITEEVCGEIIADLLFSLQKRLLEKGFGAAVSLHEIRGIIDEEFVELREAMHQKNIDDIKAELLDLGTAVLFGLSSIHLWGR